MELPDEFDEIWEISMFGNTSYWVDEETYDRIKADFVSGEFKDRAVVIETIYGAEIVVQYANISEMTYCTKQTREDSREINRIYKKETDAAKKEWE